MSSAATWPRCPISAIDSALKSLGGKWTPDRIQQFIANPKEYAPGTKMTFAGLKNIDDRANVIAYLQTLN